MNGTRHDEAWSGEDLPHWPKGTVRRLLDTDLVTEPTRAALRGRLERPAAQEPRFLPPEPFLTLRAACARLLPQPERDEAGRVDVAADIDCMLGKDEGNGWRYSSMPPDAEAYRAGLGGIEEAAEAMFGAPFPSLEPTRQDAVLAAVQAGAAPGPTWATLPAGRFFEEMLVLAAEVYYAHPLAQEEIGYAGMADARGWQGIGLGEREPHEPEPIASAPDGPAIFSGTRAAE